MLVLVRSVPFAARPTLSCLCQSCKSRARSIDIIKNRYLPQPRRPRPQGCVTLPDTANAKLSHKAARPHAVSLSSNARNGLVLACMTTLIHELLTHSALRTPKATAIKFRKEAIAYDALAGDVARFSDA